MIVASWSFEKGQRMSGKKKKGDRKSGTPEIGDNIIRFEPRPSGSTDDMAEDPGFNFDGFE